MTMTTTGSKKENTLTDTERQQCHDAIDQFIAVGYPVKLAIGNGCPCCYEKRLLNLALDSGDIERAETILEHIDNKAHHALDKNTSIDNFIASPEYHIFKGKSAVIRRRLFEAQQQFEAAGNEGNTRTVQGRVELYADMARAIAERPGMIAADLWQDRRENARLALGTVEESGEPAVFWSQHSEALVFTRAQRVVMDTGDAYAAMMMSLNEITPILYQMDDNHHEKIMAIIQTQHVVGRYSLAMGNAHGAALAFGSLGDHYPEWKYAAETHDRDLDHIDDILDSEYSRSHRYRSDQDVSWMT